MLILIHNLFMNNKKLLAQSSFALGLFGFLYLIVLSIWSKQSTTFNGSLGMALIGGFLLPITSIAGIILGALALNSEHKRKAIWGIALSAVYFFASSYISYAIDSLTKLIFIS